ncbi:AraC family transcriptional regulator [Prosthecobacter sp.]|uniref:helix-turn-helix domain-containing protein n=1 Tax=Prosthecobacter sp. TaxID=1965333 RepID=UPI002488B202|nr:AraC family transcriptional regulator [Prosthecobacter sp.]MDI1313420.1 AraC family transcriptional regulator [Prosthecobacter sp.]
MKPIVEMLSPLAAAEPVVCEVVRGQDFGCVWHYHPECEITLVLKGGSERLVGNNISRLEPGDLVLMGTNVPHDYRNQHAVGAPPEEVEAIVVQFMPQLPGHEDWMQRSSMIPIRRLFQRAEQGLEVRGITRLTAARIVQEMLHVHGMKRVILLLQLLDLLSNSEELQEISSAVLPQPRPGASDRITLACEYIAAHLPEPIYVADLAAIVGLGKSAFSRLFKKSTGRTVPQYVNELRIARACLLLAETDLTVSQISMDCGFVSPAHFQRQFREHQHCVPLVYRSRVAQPV